MRPLKFNMFRFYFSKQTLVGFLLALIILSWLAISSYLNTKKIISSSQMVAHTLDVLYNTERVLTITTNIELGQRGYSLTGNENFLEPYYIAKSNIDNHLTTLEKLTIDNKIQQENIGKLKDQIKELMQFSSSAVESRKESLEASIKLNTSMEGKKIMDSIRAAISRIDTEENRLLKTRNLDNENQVQRFNYTFIALMLVAGLILVVIFVAINRNLKVRLEAEQKLQAAIAESNDLYNNAPCGYHSLDSEGRFVNVNNTLASWLGYEKKELLGKKKFSDVIHESDLPLFHKNFRIFKETGSIYNLEFNFVKKDGSEFPVMLNAVAIHDDEGNFVKSRSITIDDTERREANRKIAHLNQELEAFTYSVSHDLRAPLRSIDGYTKILEEDYLDKLDNEGKRVINVIMSNAKRMGKLIDDLLDFARLGRKDIARSRVNMTQLVANIVREQSEQEPDRKIIFKISPLIPSYVDADMMRQVWENLISNAIKYSSKHSTPSIEIDSIETENEICYTVRDNGVGFDMQYAPKLFGVFQRLHKIQDFDGTGVGLAIVKRVVDRHHGRVWAEAQINKGATFYFTIPSKNGKQ